MDSKQQNIIQKELNETGGHDKEILIHVSFRNSFEDLMKKPGVLLNANVQFNLFQ